MSTDIYQQADSELADLFGDEEFEENDDLANDSFATVAQDGPATIEQDVGNDELADIMRGSGMENMNWEEIGSMSIGQDEKAADAQDYEDIGDDDSLPDEEIPTSGGVGQPDDQMLPDIVDSAMDEGNFNDDDLFGPSSPTDNLFEPKSADPSIHQQSQLDQDPDLASDYEDEDTQAAEEMEPEISEEEMAQWRIQQQLFAQSGKGFAPTTLDENIDEWLKLEFPDFKRDETPFWTRLLPPKPQRYQFKTPAKPPKPVRPSKVNLEIELDQRVLFTSAAAAASVHEQRRDLVKVSPRKVAAEDAMDLDESDSDDPLPGGLTMQDLTFICTDFDTLSNDEFSDSGVGDLGSRAQSQDEDLFGADDDLDRSRPVKKRRLGMSPDEIVAIRQIDLPSFDDPEQLTSRLAQEVTLDFNDPALLLEEVDMDAIQTRSRPGEQSSRSKSVKDRLKSRFKTSNDAEYDLLKQNHQQKIRGLLGHMTIEHSLPAVRLQYPYYKVKMPLDELRNYHRKRLAFKQPILFTKSNKVKRKEKRSKPTKELYSYTKDLSLADNSSALLLEYSEEHPIMLSQTGMGNRVVNYYRRRAGDDTSRPKGEIGETNVLLPEDKSPFYAFGPIDPGETVTALYNSMYRAPIFEHPNNFNDYLVVRETTGQEGARHHLRNIDHTYAVGQELPSVTVPGTHSRMVTTASKNRLKAISFRVARRKKSNRIRVEEVTRHFPDTTDMQNRQKMKEFMVFSKEHKEWEMRAGEAIPDEAAIQQLIKPEDICLLESMQVGHQYLQDAGYADRDDEDDDDGKDNETDSVEQQLAPWKTTKNFLQATQGKAMLKLYGEGDPSGRGEAFSFIKTSMKGGFKAVGGSVQDTLSMKKELGGHSYNVARQQRSYEESIRGIWDKQKASLSSTIEPSDFDDDGVDEQIEQYSRSKDPRSTPVSGTPGPSRRVDDETATSFSKRSITSQAQRHIRVTRTVYIDGEYVEQTEIISDPLVMKQYLRIKEEEEAQSVAVADIEPTGDADFDARQQKRIREQLAKLEKAKARRNQREKTKAALNAGSPGAASPDADGATPSGKQVQATQRKCANCGQVGHIKTNKKLCPLLNGTIKQDDQFNNAAFMGAPPALS